MAFPRQLHDGDTVARAETMVATDMGGETVMMSVETGQYFHLDDIASDVWRRLEQPQRVDDLVAQLVETYDVSLDDCRKDTLDLLVGLIGAGVLRVAAEAP